MLYQQYDNRDNNDHNFFINAISGKHGLSITFWIYYVLSGIFIQYLKISILSNFSTNSIILVCLLIIINLHFWISSYAVIQSLDNYVGYKLWYYCTKMLIWLNICYQLIFNPLYYWIWNWYI